MLHPIEHVRGRARMSLVAPDGRELIGGCWQHNAILYDWATIVGNRLIKDSPNYKLSFMYIEFENVAHPTDPVSLPVISRSGGIAYYEGLAHSLVRNYLRVPIISGVLTSSNTDHFPQGNLLTFYAQSQGVTGLNGLPFSNSHNSKVFGAALVAAPDPSDATQDLVFARLYYAAADQQVKPSTSAQIGITWEELLG